MTMLIKLNDQGQPDGNPPIIDSNFRALFPDRIFPQILFPQEVEAVGFGLYDYSPQPKLDRYQKAVEVLPVKDERGIWMQTWSVVDMDPDEKARVDATMGTNVRFRRFHMLMECDWTQLPDSQLADEKKAVWRAYRQELRDVTKQSGFPWSIVWPTRPVN